MELMSRKMAAATALDGELSAEGLAAMADDESAAMALARSLANSIGSGDIARNWSKVNSKPAGSVPPPIIVPFPTPAAAEMGSRTCPSSSATPGRSPRTSSSRPRSRTRLSAEIIAGPRRTSLPIPVRFSCGQPEGMGQEERAGIFFHPSLDDPMTWTLCMAIVATATALEAVVDRMLARRRRRPGRRGPAGARLRRRLERQEVLLMEGREGD